MQIKDQTGRKMTNRVFEPDEIYGTAIGDKPDFMVYFDDLDWRSAGTVGHDSLYLSENDTGPDDCNHAQFGSFLLAAPNLPVRGEIEGMHLLDIAPTLLELAGEDVPASMQGASLLTRSRGEVACR